MKKTTKKLSLGMKIASVLACLAIVSVGFASWWIVQLPDPEPVDDGSFTVYSVNTKNIKIENVDFAYITPARNPAVKSSNIIFGKTTGVTQRWLLADDDVAEQNLTATFTFDVNLYDDYQAGQVNDLGEGAISDYISEITLDFLPTGIDSAIGNGYIAKPVITYSYGTDSTDTVTYEPSDESDTATLHINMEDASSNSVTVTVTVEFNWGATFGGQNPYVYYNAAGKNPTEAISEDDETTWAEHADAALTGLYGLNNASNYEITLTAKIVN